MSYNPVYEASKALPVDKITEQLEHFAAAGQDLSRRHFSRSPPPVPSVPSTDYEESDPPSPGAQLRDRESKELQNSRADNQYTIQINDELDRIHAARDMGLIQQPNLPDWEEAAAANVKYRWMRQGIWDDLWDTQPSKIWKHELQHFPPPLGPSNSSIHTEGRRVGGRKKREHSDLEDKSQDTVQCALDFQNRQSSRPCYQFVHQFCEERQWIKMGFSKHDQDQHANLDTRAYKDLKSRWIRDGIWDDDWSFIPGVSWKHERPQKNPPPQELFRRLDAQKAARMEQAERPPDWYFMAPTEPFTMIHREYNLTFPFEGVSELSGPSILEPSSKVNPPRRNQSVTSHAPKEMDISRSTRQATVKAKPNPAGQEHNKRPTRSPAMRSSVNKTTTKTSERPHRKQKIQTPQWRTARPRPLRKRSSAKGDTHHSLIQETKNQIYNDTGFARPRRVAAVEAMKKLTKAT
ncbi:MAG: hypothetical protein Q9214_004153 [Letrouitia sp. 1 TL-2023]